MKIVVTAAPPEAMITLEGELDIASAPDLRSAVGQALLRQESQLVLDVAGLTFLDSAGLCGLLHCFELADDAGGTLTIAGRSPGLERLLRLMDADPALDGLWPDLAAEGDLGEL